MHSSLAASWSEPQLDQLEVSLANLSIDQLQYDKVSTTLQQ